MIKPIVTNKKILAFVSDPVTDEDPVDQIIRDLLATAKHYQAKPIGCVGLASNQIGRLKRVIAVWHGAQWVVMINPVIQVRDGKQGLSHEACLSRPGVRRKIKRHKRIKVAYRDQDKNLVVKNFSGFTARIIQHEVDHLDGIFI